MANLGDAGAYTAEYAQKKSQALRAAHAQLGATISATGYSGPVAVSSSISDEVCANIEVGKECIAHVNSLLDRLFGEANETCSPNIPPSLATGGAFSVMSSSAIDLRTRAYELMERVKYLSSKV